MRAWWPASETIIFAEHYGADNIAKGEAGYAAKCDELRGFVFEPLRAYLDGERERARLTCGALHEAWCAARGTKGHMVGHWFGRSQWMLPTAANYAWLAARAPGFFQQPYEDLRAQYEDLRAQYEALRRPFNVSASVPYTDVWTYPTVQSYPGKHPCEKPRAMADDIIRASSRPGGVVADFFSGSGVFASSAVALGRRAIACDMDLHWADVSRKRCAEAEEHGFAGQRTIAPLPRRPEPEKPAAKPKRQLDLLDV